MSYLLTFFYNFDFSPSRLRTPPPPRQLADVLASSDLANEFHAYLADMDQTHDEYTKQTYLNFDAYEVKVNKDIFKYQEKVKLISQF